MYEKAAQFYYNDGYSIGERNFALSVFLSGKYDTWKVNGQSFDEFLKTKGSYFPVLKRIERGKIKEAKKIFNLSLAQYRNERLFIREVKPAEKRLMQALRAHDEYFYEDLIWTIRSNMTKKRAWRYVKYLPQISPKFRRYTSYFNIEAERLNDKGYELASLGRYKDAMKCFNSALKMEPDYLYAIFNLGQAYVSLGKKRDAILLYKKTLGRIIDPYDRDTFNRIKWEYDKLIISDKPSSSPKPSGRAKAGFILNVRNMFFPSYEGESSDNYIAQGAHNEAVELALKKDYYRAEILFKKAISIDPQFLAAYSSLGYVYIQTNRSGEAIKLYRKALAENKDLSSSRIFKLLKKDLNIMEKQTSIQRCYYIFLLCFHSFN
ncbi:MAG: tetratricopeptide repeat protein [Elusimicrobia bacterium]|nr:tetratricopeptide repeat protein [Elusimicrobiota bacterium]